MTAVLEPVYCSTSLLLKAQTTGQENYGETYSVMWTQYLCWRNIHNHPFITLSQDFLHTVVRGIGFPWWSRGNNYSRFIIIHNIKKFPLDKKKIIFHFENTYLVSHCNLTTTVSKANENSQFLLRYNSVQDGRYLKESPFPVIRK